MAAHVDTRAVVKLLCPSKGGSSPDGGQFLFGFRGPASYHPCHQQGICKHTSLVNSHRKSYNTNAIILRMSSSVNIFLWPVVLDWFEKCWSWASGVPDWEALWYSAWRVHSGKWVYCQGCFFFPNTNLRYFTKCPSSLLTDISKTWH